MGNAVATRFARELADSTGWGNSSADLDAIQSLLMRGPVTTDQLIRDGYVGPEDEIFLVAHKMEIDTPVHSHDYFEFIYVLGGMVGNQVEGKRLYLTDGSLCIMSRGSSHSLEVEDPDAIVVNLCLRFSLFGEGIFRRYLESDNPVSAFLRGDRGGSYLILTDDSNRALRSTMLDVMAEYGRSKYRESFSLAGIVLRLLDESARAESYSFYGVDQRTAEILQYISENYSVASVSSVAREFGLNESYLTQYMHKHTGKSTSRTITEVKLANAMELLRETDETVDAIADAVGYQSPSHFYQVFRRQLGMSPNEFRMNRLQGGTPSFVAAHSTTANTVVAQDAYRERPSFSSTNHDKKAPSMKNSETL